MDRSKKWKDEDDEEEGDDQFWDQRKDNDDEDDESYNLGSDVDANNHETFDCAAEWNEEEHDDLIAQDNILSRPKIVDVEDLERQLLGTRLTASTSNNDRNRNDLEEHSRKFTPLQNNNQSVTNQSTNEIFQPHPMLLSKRSGWSPFGGKDFFNPNVDNNDLLDNAIASNSFNIGSSDRNIMMNMPPSMAILEHLDRHLIEQQKQQLQQNQHHQLQQRLHQQQLEQHQQQHRDQIRQQLIQQQLMLHEQLQQDLHKNQQQHHHQQELHQMQQTAILKLHLLQQHQQQQQQHQQQQQQILMKQNIPQTQMMQQQKPSQSSPQVFTVEELERQMLQNARPKNGLQNEPTTNPSQQSRLSSTQQSISNRKSLEPSTHKNQQNQKSQTNPIKGHEKHPSSVLSHNKREHDRNHRNDKFNDRFNDKEYKSNRDHRNRDNDRDRPRDRDRDRDRDRVRDKRENNRDRRQLGRNRLTIIPPQVQLSVLDKAKRLHSLTAMHSDEFLKDKMPTSVEGFVFNRHSDVRDEKPTHDGILTEEERSWLTRIQNKIQADYDGNMDQDYYYLLYFNNGSKVADDTNQKPAGSGFLDRRFIPRERLLYNN